MSATDWARSFKSLGGTLVPSRWTQKPIALTDHCYAVIQTCPRCHNKFVRTAAEPHCHCAKDAA